MFSKPELCRESRTRVSLIDVLQLGEVQLGTLVSRQACGIALTNDSVVPVLRGNGNVVNVTATIISAGQFCVQANAAAPSQPEIVSFSNPLALHTASSILEAKHNCCGQG